MKGSIIPLYRILAKPLYTPFIQNICMCSPYLEPPKNIHLVLNMKYQN